MNIDKIYQSVGDNAEEVVGRLVSRQNVERFLTKFASDNTFATLQKAMDEADVQGAFIAAHTLKGVALNLGFSALGRSASDLTEILRRKTFDGAPEAFAKVQSDYNRVLTAIRTY